MKRCPPHPTALGDTWHVLLTRPPLVTPGMPSSPNLPWCYVAGASSVPNYSKRACDDCRYCPEFSALYGHKVYICKRLEGVAELA